LSWCSCGIVCAHNTTNTTTNAPSVIAESIAPQHSIFVILYQIWLVDTVHHRPATPSCNAMSQSIKPNEWMGNSLRSGEQRAHGYRNQSQITTEHCAIIAIIAIIRRMLCGLPR
jgi:hypothetical protein